MLWFIQDLARLENERSRIETLESDQPWLEGVVWQITKNGVGFDCEIVLDGKHSYPVHVQFPQFYPSVPPSVAPIKNERWSEHQYGSGGDLCLEIGPDNWLSDEHRAADLLESTFRLLSLEYEYTEGEESNVPSRHSLTQGQQLRFDLFRFMLTPAVQEALTITATEGNARCKLIQLFHEDSMIVFLQSIERVNDEDWLNPDLPSELIRQGRTVHGVILSNTNIEKNYFREASLLTKLLEEQSFPDPKNTDKPVTVEKIEYVFDHGPQNQWKVSVRWDSGAKSSICTAALSDTTPMAERHGYDTWLMANKTVAIIGLGSAGSKLATMLARSGVTRFLLMDDDILHPSNLVRHDSDWSQVGRHKAEAAAVRLRLISASIVVTVRKHRLSGQEATSSAASAVSAIGNADLIIDATANPEVFNLCAHAARQSKKALVWLEIYGGGIGGMVARSRPDKDPEPFTLREAITNAGSEIADAKQVVPPETVANYTQQDDDVFLVASDADVSSISAIAGQLALDALTEKEPSRFPYSAYFIGMSRGWIFDEPMQVIPIVSKEIGSWSTQAAKDDKETKAGAQFLVELVENNSESNANSPSDE